MPPSFIADSKEDTPTDIQQQTRELKHELKAWEAAFQTEHGRAPERDDLSHSPEMAAKYRQYSRLKKTSKQTAVATNAVPERKTEILKRKKSANQEALAETSPLLPSWLLASKTRMREPTDQISKRPRVYEEGALAKDEVDIDGDEDGGVNGDTQRDLSKLPPLPHIATTPRICGCKLDIERSPHSPSLQGIVGSTRSLTLGGTNTSLFKARAGKLIKTTSIPISTFGAQFRGASEILTSQQPHFSDDNQHMAESHDNDNDDEELVVEEEKEADIENKDDKPTEKFKKKATQKRGTRRVKIKPIGKDGEVESLSSRIRKPKDGNSNLVSNNFYKLKLKNGRRAPKSTEERRLAFYKRLVGKKNKNPTSQNNNTDQNDIYYAHNEGDFELEVTQEVGEDEDAAEWGSSDLEEQNSKSTSSLSHSKSQKRRRRLLAGEPLDLFYAEDDLEQSLTFTPGSSAAEATALDLSKVLSHVWGYDDFKPGQLDAINRILNGHSTLLLLATGAGKSLVYQLPSLILSSLYSGLTVVVTPLIALMKDQIQHLPKGIKAICMSHESSSRDRYASMASQLISGQFQLLFISPERLQSPQFQKMMSIEGMPAIKLAVVDEAHCASEWSHNFRPAYLQLPQQLRSLGVECVLALTGTATSQLADSLCHMFGIDHSQGVVRGEMVRDNITLGVVPVDLGSDIRSKTPAREATLLNILKSPEMLALDSILVYVSTQASADRVAEYLTSRSIPAQSYHAGKPASERTRIQTAFMNEEKKRKEKGANGGGVAIRVLVATVAFGMGLNKSNIRAVIHYNLPRSMESYVQEIGRAGRDGAPARGILLLAVGTDHMKDSEQQQIPVAGDTNISPDNSLCSTDAVLVRSWAHSDGIEPASARRLLLKLFPADFVNEAIEKAIKAYTSQAPPESALWKESKTVVLELKNLEKDLDAGQIVVQTLINYLAMKDPDMFQVEPNTNRRCVIQFTRTELGKLAEEHPFFSKLANYINGQSGMADHAGERRRSGRGGRSLVNIPGQRKSKTTSITVDIFDLATSIGISIPDVTSELYKWRARRELMLEWQDPSCVVKVTLDLKKFVDTADLSPSLQCGETEAVEQAKEKVAQEIDQYILKLTKYVSSQNDARVQDSVNRVNILESVMLSALQIPTEQTQCKFLQTAMKAYFARSQQESAEIACKLKQYADTGNEGSPGLEHIMSYFRAEESNGGCSGKDLQQPRISSEVCARISSFVQKHHADIATGRAAARVFHGLSGPGCSSAQWIWCAEWGSLLWVDFDAIRKCAQEELVKVHIHNTIKHP